MGMRYLFSLIIIILLSPLHSLAQELPYEDRLAEELSTTDTDFFTFTLENDSLGNGADQNYTSGVRISYFNHSANPPEFAKNIAEYIPTFDINETTSTSYSFGQNLYTPKDISTPIANPNDRPYAAFLYASAGLTSVTNNHSDDLEITIGVIGPLAFGEGAQKSIHKILKAEEPKGWDHQLSNEPGLILSWQRQWPEAYTHDIGKLTFRAMPHTGASLGNVYTYGAGGVTFQLTPKRFQWQSQPLRVRPSIPGNGFFIVPEKNFAWSLFAATEGRAMGRNIFLDGNSFESSPSVDKKILVGDASLGARIIYGKAQLSYTLNWRSKEFEGQEDTSVFGAMTLGYRF